jgi:hypothetical protein
MPDPRKPDLSRIALGVAGFAVASTALAGFLLAAGSRLFETLHDGPLSMLVLWVLVGPLVFLGAAGVAVLCRPSARPASCPRRRSRPPRTAGTLWSGTTRICGSLATAGAAPAGALDVVSAKLPLK